MKLPSKTFSKRTELNVLNSVVHCLPENLMIMTFDFFECLIEIEIMMNKAFFDGNIKAIFKRLDEEFEIRERFGEDTIKGIHEWRGFQSLRPTRERKLNCRIILNQQSRSFTVKHRVHFSVEGINHDGDDHVQKEDFQQNSDQEEEDGTEVAVNRSPFVVVVFTNDGEEDLTECVCRVAIIGQVSSVGDECADSESSQHHHGHDDERQERMDGTMNSSLDDGEAIVLVGEIEEWNEVGETDGESGSVGRNLRRGDESVERRRKIVGDVNVISEFLRCGHENGDSIDPSDELNDRVEEQDGSGRIRDTIFENRFDVSTDSVLSSSRHGNTRDSPQEVFQTKRNDVEEEITEEHNQENEEAPAVASRVEEFSSCAVDKGNVETSNRRFDDELKAV